ncbi:MAG: acetylxylan esterase [Draconibacterium sp.]
MNKIKYLLLSTAFVLLAISGAFAQTLILKQSNQDGIYKKGENVRVSLLVRDLKSDSLLVKTDKNFSTKAKWKSIAAPEKELVLLSGKFDEPVSMICSVKAGDEVVSTGVIVDSEELNPATKRPKDFDSYWKKEKKALRKLPLKLTVAKVENTEAGYVCEDVEINCVGPKPARGYFAKPENAEKGSLPIVLNVHAAGVKGSWCLSRPETALRYAKKGKGALSFDLNAHGMLNGQPQEYYDQLEAGELKNYWEIGAEDREQNYFRGMYLRLLRTLDFLCAQPEWDGKRIIVIGESQGGGQALAAAGLDPRVTAVVATVPAMCDFGRTLIGQTGGWPKPFGFQKDKEKMLKTFPYFDAVHALKGSKATLVVEIGLVDYTCPAFGIFAAVNQSEVDKVLLVTPYRAHHLEQKQFQKEWEEMVYKPKIKFIEAFLQ